MSLSGASSGHILRHHGDSPAPAVADWRKEFPALESGSYVYLDNAATAHRPKAVLDAIVAFYHHHNGNPGRGLHMLAEDADAQYEAARARIASFIGATDPLEVLFTRGTTEAINLVATAWGGTVLRPGDEVWITSAEHYSNLLPWQLVAQRSGARLRFLEVDESGYLVPDEVQRVLTPRAKLVSVSHVSNVLGVVNPVREIADQAHSVGAKVLVDGAQSAPHLPINVHDLGCDFFAFSGHKLMGPMGSGALWARRELLEEMPPYQAGGDMAYAVTRNTARYAPGARKFEAGTPNVADAVGFATAVDYLETQVGWERFRTHENALVARLLDCMPSMKGVCVIGPTDSARAKQRRDKIALMTFVVAGYPAVDLVKALDKDGFGVRGGDLAALPLLSRFGVDAAVRVSAYLYTLSKEVDRFLEALERILHSR